MAEPFEDQLFLDKSDVKKLFGIKSRTQWDRFLKSTEGKLMPAPVSLAGTKWHRDEIMAFARLLKRIDVPKT